MNRRNFLLAIPFLAVASKVKAKPIVDPLFPLPLGDSGKVLTITGGVPEWTCPRVTMPGTDGIISFKDGVFKTDDPEIIHFMENHPMNQARDKAFKRIS